MFPQKKNKKTRVTCPICLSEYVKFASYTPFDIKSIKVSNVFCTTCYSFERHRLLWKYLHEKTDIFSRRIKLLQFAPEGFFVELFTKSPNIQYFPVDISPDLYKYNGKINVLKADITKIPFEDDYFDVILCSHVLEHIENDSLAMSELYRVMNKNGGWGIFQVPVDHRRRKTYEDFSITDEKGRTKAFNQPDHVRIYGKDYATRLQNAGFDVTIDSYVKSFTKKEIFRYGFDKKEFIYVCKKK